MIHQTVYTSNIIRAVNAMDALQHASMGEERMGLIYGEPGLGKTTAVKFLVNKTNGIFLRANIAWTVTSFLQTLLKELDVEPGYRRAPMMEDAIRELAMQPRPIIIDEADYLLRQIDMLDALRDIYDHADIPVVMVMMEEAPRKLKAMATGSARGSRTPSFSRFTRRVTQWVEFQPVALDDVITAADELAEVAVQDDLCERILDETGGNMGRVVIALGLVEAFARANGVATVGLADYGERALTHASRYA